MTGSDTKSPAEQEFEDRLNALYNDARSCAVFAYTLLTIDNTTDHALLECLNAHAEFWNGIRASLQASTFVALGRIYDRRPDTHTAARLLDCAETNIGIFSEQYLRHRKNNAGLSAEDAEDYAREAHRLQRSELAALRAEFDAMQQSYRDTVQPIRHEVFAHAGNLTHAEREALFTNLMIRELERLCVFPLRLFDALFKTYYDGHAPVLRDAPTIVGEVLTAGAPQGTTTWEHQHVAAAADNFLQFLLRAARELGVTRD